MVLFKHNEAFANLMKNSQDENRHKCQHVLKETHTSRGLSSSKLNWQSYNLSEADKNQIKKRGKRNSVDEREQYLSSRCDSIMKRIDKKRRLYRRSSSEDAIDPVSSHNFVLKNVYETPLSVVSKSEKETEREQLNSSSRSGVKNNISQNIQNGYHGNSSCSPIHIECGIPDSHYVTVASASLSNSQNDSPGIVDTEDNKSSQKTRDTLSIKRKRFAQRRSASEETSRDRKIEHKDDRSFNEITRCGFKDDFGILRLYNSVLKCSLKGRGLFRRAVSQEIDSPNVTRHFKRSLSEDVKQVAVSKVCCHGNLEHDCKECQFLKNKIAALKNANSRENNISFDDSVKSNNLILGRKCKRHNMYGRDICRATSEDIPKCGGICVGCLVSASRSKDMKRTKHLVDRPEITPNYGSSVLLTDIRPYASSVQKKSVVDAYILAVSLGFFGAHHFYLRRPGWGVLYFFTLSLLGVGYLFDLIRLPWLVKDTNYRLQSGTTQNKKRIDDAYLLWFPFGLLGLHHFYLRRTGLGLLYFFTFGLFGIGWIVDAFLMPSYVRKANEIDEDDGEKSLFVSMIFAISPFGLLGANHFYLNRIPFGLLYFFTFGLCGVGYFIDWFRTPFLVKRYNKNRDTGIFNERKYVDDAYLLWFPLGFLGLHHFYLHRPGWGFLYLFTFGLFGIGWLIDGCRIPCLVKDFNDHYSNTSVIPTVQASIPETTGGTFTLNVGGNEQNPVLPPYYATGGYQTTTLYPRQQTGYPMQQPYPGYNPALPPQSSGYQQANKTTTLGTDNPPPYSPPTEAEALPPKKH